MGKCQVVECNDKAKQGDGVVAGGGRGGAEEGNWGRAVYAVRCEWEEGSGCGDTRGRWSGRGKGGQVERPPGGSQVVGVKNPNRVRLCHGECWERLAEGVRQAGGGQSVGPGQATGIRMCLRGSTIAVDRWAEYGASPWCPLLGGFISACWGNDPALVPGRVGMEPSLDVCRYH